MNASADVSETFYGPRRMNDHPVRRLWRWVRRKLRLCRRGTCAAAAAAAARSVNRSVLERGEAARAWEGVWPQVPSAASSAAGSAAAAEALAVSARAELSQRGFVPLSVKAGDLVVLAGTLDHLSLPNGSPDARHSFQLHAIEGPRAGVSWAKENWLQTPGKPFLDL